MTMVNKPQCFVSDLIRALHELAPPQLAEHWDNVGLMVGDPAAPLQRVMTCLELTAPVLDEARRRRVQAIVAHHPLIFKPLTALNLGQPVGLLVADLIGEQIALVAAHTNLDAAIWSTNTVLAEACGFDSAMGQPLLPQEAGDEGPVPGVGLVIPLNEKMPLNALVDQVKQRLGLKTLRLAGPERKQVRTVALCSGSGGSFIGRAAMAADAYITGEMNYHHAIEAHQRKLPVLEIGHYESEVLIAQPLAAKLAQTGKLKAAQVEVIAASSDLQPFRFS